MLGDDFTRGVLETVNTRIILDCWNDIVVLLIPKVESAEK
jgi:hypothetical protein